MPTLPGPFAAWRWVELNDQEVLQTRLLPGLTPSSPEVREWLAAWSGPRYPQPGPEGWELTLTRRTRPRPGERRWLHALLLAATLATATVAGALLAPGDPLRVGTVTVAGQALAVPTRLSAAGAGAGLWFALPLLCILGAHELGHWALARRHGMDVSPPYFIPAPWLLSPIGTFGAFIRLRSPLLNRAALLDMGAAGPLVGFALAVPAYLAGLLLSRPFDARGPGGARVGVLLSDGVLPLGESPLLLALRALSPLHGASFVALHPLAVAGWFGLLFTGLNLFPASQLDGGHVVYALSPRLHPLFSRLTVAGLMAMGFAYSGWWMWAALILLIGRGRVGHPPVLDPGYRLNGPRRAVAWACIAVFLLVWVPVPLPL